MKTTYVYHDGRVLSKRIRRVELAMQQWRRDTALLVGAMVIFTIATAIGTIAAPHVWPLLSDAIAHSVVNVPHYR